MINPFLGFRAGSPTTDVLVLQEVPYTLVAWTLLASAVLMAALATYRHMKVNTPKGTLLALLGASVVCAGISVWVLGVQYQYTFLRRQSTIEIQQSWFGRTVDVERLTYVVAPVASVVTDKNRRQLVLVFGDGSVKRLGMSTDRLGHERVAQMINEFLATGSIHE